MDGIAAHPGPAARIAFGGAIRSMRHQRADYFFMPE
jgi:hypothetical protein